MRNWCVLVWVVALHAAAVYLFASGFFLTRVELHTTAACSGSHCDLPFPPRYRKAVVLVVDALRYDFVAPVVTDVDAAYENKLGAVHRLLDAQDGRAALFRFRADPPTVTAQRLKGLTTGSMPTFIDASSNFASPAIKEDNWVHQAGKALPDRLVFMGDDTWEELYPSAFNTSYPFPSFNVFDLHTVDQGVVQHLVPEMSTSNWSVIVAHMLGVDHVGHRYGPSHPSMAAKLKEVDDAIASVVDALDEDTLLVVLGDHGMTSTGNHGGATRPETDAALLLFSKAGVVAAPPTGTTVAQVDLVPTLSLLLGLPIPYSNVGSAMPNVLYRPPGVAPDEDPSGEAAALRTNVAQVHKYLHAYSAAGGSLLSTPGGVELEALYAAAQSAAAPPAARAYLAHALALCQSAWTQFNVPVMVWGVAVSLMATATLAVLVWAAPDAIVINGPFALTPEEAMAAQLPDEVGAQLRIVVDREPFRPLKPHLLGAVCGCLAWVAVASYVGLPPLSLEALLYPAVFPLAGAAPAGAVLAFLWAWLSYRGWLAASGLRTPVQPLMPHVDTSLWGVAHLPSLAGCGVLVLRLAGLLGNSYMESEPQVLLFLSAAVTGVLGLRALRAGGRPLVVGGTVAAACVLGRLAVDNTLDRLAPASSFGISFGFLGAVGVPVALMWLARHSAWRRLTPSVVLWAAVICVATIVLCLFWSLEAVHDARPNAGRSRGSMPRVVYGCCAVAAGIAVFASWRTRRSTFVSDREAEKKQSQDEIQFDVVEAVVGQPWAWSQPASRTAKVNVDYEGRLLLKGEDAGAAASRRRAVKAGNLVAPPLGPTGRDAVMDVLMVLGALLPGLLLLLGRNSGPSVVLMLAHGGALIALLHLSSKAGYMATAAAAAPATKAAPGGDGASDGVTFVPVTVVAVAKTHALVTFDAVMAWSLLAALHFYATGHGMRFNAVDWTAPFLGFTTVSILRSGAMVLANTFASQIVFGVGLPLLVVVGMSHAHPPPARPRPDEGAPTPRARSVRLMEAVADQVAHDNSTGNAQVMHATLSSLLVQSAVLTVFTCFLAAQRRHLMVWRVFAPKYTFEAVIALVMGAAAVVLWPLWVVAFRKA